MTLSPQQSALLERVCLKRYQVRFSHYMGSFQPNESVQVFEDGRTGTDNTFRPATAHGLRSKNLVRFHQYESGASELRPTLEGLAAFRAMREKETA